MTEEIELCVGGVSTRLLAQRFGTPLFAYDLGMVRERWRKLRASVPRRFEIFYAVKANPSRAIVHLLASEGAGVDVASEGELLLALDARVPAKRIVVTGPAKSQRLLALAVRARVAAIHCEGPHELSRIHAEARRQRRVQAVSLRLNPGWGIAERRRIIGGPGAHKFGIDLRMADRFLAVRRSNPNVRIVGFQLFNASNVLDARLLAGNARRTLDLAARLARRHQLRVDLVDFGGGLGIPYADDEAELDLALLGRLLERAAARRFSRARLILEPGRFLVGPAGVYLTRVMDVKLTRGRRHLLVDGGIHHLLRPALIGTPHRVRLVPGAARRRARAARPACVSGPLCTSLDVLHAQALLPEIRPGDLLAILDAGAYGYTESMPLFLSHPFPAEVGVMDRRAIRLRRTPTPARLIAAQARAV